MASQIQSVPAAAFAAAEAPADEAAASVLSSPVVAGTVAGEHKDLRLKGGTSPDAAVVRSGFVLLCRSQSCP